MEASESNDFIETRGLNSPLYFTPLVPLYDHEDYDVELLRSEDDRRDNINANATTSTIDSNSENTFFVSYLDLSEQDDTKQDQTISDTPQSLFLSPMTSLWSCASVNSFESIETMRDTATARPFVTNTNQTMLNYTSFERPDTNKMAAVNDWVKHLAKPQKSEDLIHNSICPERDCDVLNEPIQQTDESVDEALMDEEFVDEDDLYSMTFNPEDFSTSTNKHFDTNKPERNFQKCEVANHFTTANAGLKGDDVSTHEADETLKSRMTPRMVRTSTMKPSLTNVPKCPLELSGISSKPQNHPKVSFKPTVSKIAKRPLTLKRKTLHKNRIKKIKKYISNTFKRIKASPPNEHFEDFIQLSETVVISRYIPDLSQLPAVVKSEDTLFSESEFKLQAVFKI